MLPWRTTRALAIAGGLVAILVALLSTSMPVGWDAAAWSRALFIPLALLTAAAVGLRARAGPTAGGRLAWGALVAGVGALAVVSLSNVAPPLTALSVLSAPAVFVAAAAAFGLGVVAGARRALPRAAAIALLLAPALVGLPAKILGPVPGAALGLGIVFLVVGASTID